VALVFTVDLVRRSRTNGGIKSDVGSFTIRRS